MRIPLNEFEQLIDERILKRGLSYFKGGAITDFSEISTGEYEAIVSGTEEYTVQIEISNNIITEHNCDCPYDMGAVCKHVVAVIFHLQQDKIELDQSSNSKPTKKKIKSVSLEVKELLKSISHNELIDFVQKNSKKDKKFRNYFLASFAHLSQNQSKEFYQKQIHSILQTAAGRDGWIGWNDMKYVVNTTGPFLENAEKYLANANFENVFFISTALLEEMTEAYVEDGIKLYMGYQAKEIYKTIKKLFEKNKDLNPSKEFSAYSFLLPLCPIILYGLLFIILESFY